MSSRRSWLPIPKELLALFPAAKGQTFGPESAAELTERIRPDAVELLDLGLAELDQLIEPSNTRRGERSLRRAGELGEIAFLLTILLTTHGYSQPPPTWRPAPAHRGMM